MIAFMLAFASSSAVKKNTKAAACIGVFHRSAFKMMRAVHVVSSDFEKSQQSNEPAVTTKRAVLCVYGALCVELHYMDPQFFLENFIKDEAKVQFAKWVDLMKADQGLELVYLRSATKLFNYRVTTLLSMIENKALADISTSIFQVSETVTGVAFEAAALKKSERIHFSQFQLLLFLVLFFIFTVTYPYAERLGYWAIPASMVTAVAYLGSLLATDCMARVFGESEGTCHEFPLLSIGLQLNKSMNAMLRPFEADLPPAPPNYKLEYERWGRNRGRMQSPHPGYQPSSSSLI
jgi:hypothetical protein